VAEGAQPVETAEPSVAPAPEREGAAPGSAGAVAGDPLGVLAAAGTGLPTDLRARLARASVQERAAVVSALSRGAGNAAVARMLAPPGPMLQRQDANQSVAPTTSETWQHPEVRGKANEIEKKKDKEKPKDRGLELYLEVVPAVVRAVKGYSGKDGKQIPLENGMLMIAQATAEHGPYDPKRAKDPVIPPGNMLWGVTSESDDPSATVTTTTTEENKAGVRHSESNRKFRGYGSMDEAAEGYLKALEGTDPAAAKNPAFEKILDALKTKGMTPQGFGGSLQAAGYATAKDYGKKVANIFKTAKTLVKKFMPRIKQAQEEKIKELEDKKQAYADLAAFIETKIALINQSNDEEQQLQVDLATANGMPAKLDPQVQKEKQLLSDLGEFEGTLGK
jgi:hypothetical protein